MTPLALGNRVRQGSRTGVITIGTLRVVPLDVDIPLEHACRVRWDGSTFSVITDKRLLEKCEDPDKKQEVNDAADSAESGGSGGDSGPDAPSGPEH